MEQNKARISVYYDGACPWFFFTAGKMYRVVYIYHIEDPVQ